MHALYMTIVSFQCQDANDEPTVYIFAVRGFGYDIPER